MRGNVQQIRVAGLFSRSNVCLQALLFQILISVPAGAATYVVTSTADSGAGSLRQAILDANSNPGLDTITFNIPGTGTHTITPVSALPTITDPVIIDGTTQPGFSGTPLIELNGTSAGASTGLTLQTGNSTIRGLAINRFQSDGIDIISGGTNVIAGNFIGTDTSGLLARGNGFEGVFVSSSVGNIIGGTSPTNRNLLSGNADAGVYIFNSSSNTVLGNYIGTAVAGTAKLGNTNNGVAIYNSTGNTIGGTNSSARNIISGNGGSGVYLYGGGSFNNAVQGNYIGTSVAGNAAIGNTGDGVTLTTSLLNLIGGAVSGAGNLISGNNEAGVSLGSNASGNVVQGNLIGTDISGANALPNALAGVTIFSSGQNLIGGILSGTGNVISGNNQDGVFVLSTSVGNTIAGNYIGLNSSGTGALANVYNGITISNAAATTIGGVTGNPRNVISGNSYYGIQITGNGTQNLLQDNYIGTDASGTTAVQNHFAGVRVETPFNTVGTPGAGNLISGNGQQGIFIVGSSASSNLVLANYVGTSAGGNSALGNGNAGIGISGAPFNTIGGTGAGNLLSANGDAGIFVISSTAIGNTIAGNTIGANASGTSALGNLYEGVYLEIAKSNTVGTVGAGNLISGNQTRGIFITNSSWNVIQANMIGTKSDGVSPLPNVFHGVECGLHATNNIIGGIGTSSGTGNRIAYASVGDSGSYAGVRVRSGAFNNAILGNSIFSNGALGIDLGDFGVNPNIDCEIGVAGTANLSQNYPIITQAVIGGIGGGVGVRGTLDSSAGQTYRLEFFASPVCDSSGNGEGQIYLGDTFVTTSGSCTTNFVATFPGLIPQGYVITGTATGPTNNTSEFSPCFVGEPVPALLISNNATTVSIAWTNTTTGFVLVQTDNLLPIPQWTVVTNVPLNSGGLFVVPLPIILNSNRFFALRFQ